jgi:hypothetical protein
MGALEPLIHDTTVTEVQELRERINFLEEKPRDMESEICSKPA